MECNAFMVVREQMKTNPKSRSIDLRIDVSAAVPLPGPLEMAVMAYLPDPANLASPPVAIFAVPGGGYSRGYFDMHFAGHAGYSEAEFHTARGSIFIACDHLGVGASTIAHLDKITLENMGDSYAHAVRTLCQRIEEGTLAAGFPKLPKFAKIGIGQSLGGMATIIAQARQHVFDGIAPLGYSAIHTQLPQPTETARAESVKFHNLKRDSDMSKASIAESSSHVMDFKYPFHWEDVPKDILDADMAGGYPIRKTVPPFGSSTMPTCSLLGMTPGVVGKEAAAIRTPVLVAVGQRDVCPDPHAEPGAYRGSSDVCLFIAPRMAHMHNFASTRELLWERTAAWAARAARQAVRTPKA